MSGLSGFRSVRLTGAVIPADALVRAADGTMPGQAPSDYGLIGTLTVTAAAARAWDVLLPAYHAWKTGLAKLLEGDPATGYTRDKWLLPLLYELGYGRPTPLHAGIDLPPGLGETKPTHFPLSHQLAWPADKPTAALAIHLLGPGIDLEHKTAGITARAPHAMLQEFLNRSPEHLWGLLSNGESLRVLRDASSLARQSFLEFDLNLIFDNQLYADFRLLFTALHASRLTPRDHATETVDDLDIIEESTGGEEDEDVILEVAPAGPLPDDCWLEEWRTTAINDGARALDALREGVATALTALGTGFVSHPDNTDLTRALAQDADATTDLHRWLLRIAYRFIVLFVAEDRELLHPPTSDAAARATYDEHFSTARLRRLAATRSGTRHSDLWEAHRLVTQALGGDGNDDLALPGLAASLYEPDATGLLRDAKLSNRHLLAAVRALSLIVDKQTGSTRPVDYRNLDSEELGSVYEGLLAYVPRYDPAARTFVLEASVGNERKKSGAYYTPTDLIALVLDESLDPLIDHALRARDPEHALLSLTVCDPACGSGHFLVAAARRIAKALASVRANDPEPAPALVRAAMRDVVARCVYGVDLNELAIEIAKIALWLETLEPGRPLAFLDPHFKVGNALLGTTPALLRQGIHDAAFSVLEGDDRDWTAKLKRRNKDERERPSHGTLFDTGALEVSTTSLTEAMQTIETPEQDSIEAVRARARAWRRFDQSTDVAQAKRVADAWTAAFVQRKTAEEGPGITTGTVRALAEEPEKVAQSVREQVDRLAAEFQFFHWHLEFPGVFSTTEAGAPGADPQTGWIGGFACMLGNPPWERVKIQEKEWFSAIGRDDIANSGNAAKRRQAIAALAEVDPPLFAQYTAAQRKASATAHVLLNGGRFPLTGRGDVNTYTVFAETFRTMIGPQGSAGIVTPTGLATDKTTSAFFKDLVETRTLASLHDFVTNPRIWTDVGNRKFRFCVSNIRGKAVSTDRIRMSFFSKYPTEVTPERVFTIAPDEMELLNPNTGNCPVFITRNDADITIGAYRRHPVLVRDADIDGNAWGLAFVSMFHMSGASSLFRTADDLGVVGTGSWSIEAAAETFLPLYEAKLLWHFDHRFSSYALRAPGSRDTELPRMSDELHDDPDAESFPRYWVARSHVEAKLPEWDREWLLGWRDITGPALLRTMVPCVFPRSAVGDTFPLAFAANPQVAYLLHATWSSLACDYLVRQKITGVHLKQFIMKQVAVPHPKSFLVGAGWDPGVTHAEWIRPYVLELSYTSNRLAPYAREMGDVGRPFRWDPSRRAVLQAELDGAFMHIYGYSRSEVEHILGTFRTLATTETRAHGEYRTGRLVLDAYDRLQDAIDGRSVWHTEAGAAPGKGARHP